VPEPRFPEAWLGRVSPRRASVFLCLAKERRAGCAVPSLRCGHTALLGPGGGARKLAFGSNMRAPCPARPCATRQRMTAEGGSGNRGHFLRLFGWRGPSPQPSPQRGEGVKARLARGGVRSRLCRVAGLSSAAAWGSEIRMSEGRAADKFANFPHDVSSARNPEGARTSARLFFAYLSFGEAKESKSAAGPRPGQTKPPEGEATAHRDICE
jgi:hypothetical protein